MGKAALTAAKSVVADRVALYSRIRKAGEMQPMLKISETSKRKFTGTLRQVMGDLKVYANCFIENGDELKRLEAGVKFEGDVFSQISSYIAEEPLYVFARDWIGRELYDRPYDRDITSDMAVPLAELEELPPIETLAQEIVRDFCRLPYQYQLFLPLHKAMAKILHDEENKFDFGGGIRILRWSDEHRAKYGSVTFKGTSNGDTPFDDDPPAEEDTGPFIVLELTFSGFFDRYNKGISGEIAIEKIKSFFGLCYATGLLETYATRSLPADHVTIYRVDDGVAYAHDRSLSLDDGFKRAFARARVKEDEKFDFGRARARVLKTLNSSKSERITLASKWLFHSRGGIDQLFAFLQCTICLEILLGEQKYANTLSVGDILGNRCAYMVGRSDEDRENILKEFREIYAVRSDIVHRGKSRLSEQNKTQLGKLRGYCGRVIIREIDLIAASNKD